MGALTKSQTTTALANKLGISKADAGRYIEAFAGLACDEAKNNGSFTTTNITYWMGLEIF